MVKNGLPITTRNLVFELIWQAGRTHAVIDCMTEKDKSMEMFENSSLHSPLLLLFAGVLDHMLSLLPFLPSTDCPTVPLTHRKQPARIQVHTSLPSFPSFSRLASFQANVHPCDDVHLDQAVRLPAERARLDEQSREYYQRG